MTTNFERLQAVIDTIAMSEEDRRFVKATLWTVGEVPEIASLGQYEAYGKLAEQLSAALPPHDDP